MNLIKRELKEDPAQNTCDKREWWRISLKENWKAELYLDDKYIEIKTNLIKRELKAIMMRKSRNNILWISLKENWKT